MGPCSRIFTGPQRFPRSKLCLFPFPLNFNIDTKIFNWFFLQIIRSLERKKKFCQNFKETVLAYSFFNCNVTKNKKMWNSAVYRVSKSKFFLKQCRVVCFKKSKNCEAAPGSVFRKVNFFLNHHRVAWSKISQSEPTSVFKKVKVFETAPSSVFQKVNFFKSAQSSLCQKVKKKYTAQSSVFQRVQNFSHKPVKCVSKSHKFQKQCEKACLKK